MMADIDLFGVSFENVKGFKLPDGEGGEETFVSPPAGTIEITENDTYDVSDYANAEVSVALQMNLQEKTVSPAESQITVEPDVGYDGLSRVNVDAISGSYVGSGVARRDSTDLTASGGTVTAPAGYYAEAASKAVASGSAATPATTITANPSISVNSSTGEITAAVNASESITPTVGAGYVSSGTAGTVTASGSATEQLSTQAAQTIHPSTSDQTIASGRYLTGNQTIKAVTVSGLSADKILSGTTVKIGDSTDDDCVTSVSGSVAFQTIYTGSSAPSPSLGVDGDIYIQTA